MIRILKNVFLMLLFWSCSKEPVETLFFDLDVENGVFIACEGNFMYGNGSLSFYHTEKKSVTNQLFYARNSVPLGDVVQSLALKGNSLFIVVNNSGKIYVADDRTIEYKGSITGLTSPRYIHFVSDEKAYITDLYARHITIFNSKSFEITGKIDLDTHTSEQMVQSGKYVFTTTWSFGEYVLVIDSETDELVSKIKVPLQPRDLVIDKNGKIWVISDGGFEGSPGGEQVPALTRIDPQTFTVEQIFKFNSGDVAGGLEINSTGDTLIFMNRGVYKMPVDGRQLPGSVFIPEDNKLFYTLAVNPANDEIYVSDAIDYTQNAIVYRYSPSGNVIDSFKVGINPSYFLFR
jgi:DNA-binding beta-propeller fold protein YncE